MIQTIRNAWAVPELRKKILFTVFALLIFRLGAAIPVPYINSAGLEAHLATQSINLADNLTLRYPTHGRVARHRGELRHVHRQQQRA